MKTILSMFGGGLTLTEQSGTFTLSLNESAGGGECAGFLKGTGSLVLNGTQVLKIGEAFINSKLPAALAPLATVVEGIVNQAIAALE